MKILGLIPARHGSKGVPGKNLRKLSGFPLFAYTADAAKKSKILSSIMVSTDDEAIIQIAREYGIEVPFIRPSELASDMATSLDVIKHTIQFFEERGKTFHAICLLQPTYPFRINGLIDDCIEKFVQSKADTLFTVIPVPYQYNPHWVFEHDNDGFLINATKDKTIISSRQSLPNAYIRDGAVYICKTSVVQQQNTLYGSKISYRKTDEKWYVNIDTWQDWYNAEKIAPSFLQEHPLLLNARIF